MRRFQFGKAWRAWDAAIEDSPPDWTCERTFGANAQVEVVRVNSEVPGGMSHTAATHCFTVPVASFDDPGPFLERTRSAAWPVWALARSSGRWRFRP